MLTLPDSLHAITLNRACAVVLFVTESGCEPGRDSVLPPA